MHTYIKSTLILVFGLVSISPALGQAASPDPADILGRTPEEIHQRFTGIIEHNFAAGQPEQIIKNWQERELADLAVAYSRGGRSPSRLLGIFARGLSAESLVRVTPYFGYMQVNQAVQHYASTAVKQQYNSSSVVSALAASPSRLQPMAAPTVDMTPYEIYLEFRTAPVGSLGVAASLYETGVFMATRLYPAYLAGQVVGTEFHDLIEQYDPGLNDTIGGTIAEMLQNVENAAAAWQKGQYEQAFDRLFGSYVDTVGSSTGDYSGDYFVTDDFSVWIASYCLANGACTPNGE